MSRRLDIDVAGTGTKFLVYPQSPLLPSFGNPEVVVVNIPAGQVQPGPSDERMYVVDALAKVPYEPSEFPPYLGDQNPAVPRGRGGHFDHLAPGTREFSCAAMYATVRRVLDIWEDYLERRLIWNFEAHYARMELIPLVEWNNAHSGYGFLEFGYGTDEAGFIDHTQPYCENFDVLAHELGHSFVFAELGYPTQDAAMQFDYFGLHEAFADIVAIVSALHFDSVVDHLLDSTEGDLFSVNELSRVGELSESRQIRVAFNDLRMSDVGDEPHERSEPLTGAIFDILVEVFQKVLVSKGLITQSLADRANHRPGAVRDSAAIAADFAQAYRGHEPEFKAALLDARDYLGSIVAKSWSKLDAQDVSYFDVIGALLAADFEVAEGRYQDTIRDCFSWRQIDLPPDSMLARPHRLNNCNALLSLRRPRALRVAPRARGKARPRGKPGIGKTSSAKKNKPAAGKKSSK